MNKFMIFVVFVAILLSVQLTGAVSTENEYGSVRAWFNGQEATVKNAELKINEPAEITVMIISKIDGDLTFKLTNPLTTVPYKLLSGENDIEKWTDVYNVNSGWSRNYTWKIAPNGAWTNANAPINILVQFNKGTKNKQIEFTIANPYILDEQYTGSPSITPPASSTPAPSRTTPFPSALFALAALAAVRRWRR